jgi:hypothetical protein
MDKTKKTIKDLKVIVFSIHLRYFMTSFIPPVLIDVLSFSLVFGGFLLARLADNRGVLPSQAL